MPFRVDRKVSFHADSLFRIEDWALLQPERWQRKAHTWSSWTWNEQILQAQPLD